MKKMSNCIRLKGVEFCDKNKTCNDALSLRLGISELKY